MSSSNERPLPARIGRYEILRRLAQGGMAEVFLGRVVGTGGYQKLVAIKRILPHLAEDKSFVGMFIDEARISAGLSHSNIAQIFDFGQAGSSFFIAIEHVRGVNLRAILNGFRKRDKVPPPAMVATIMARVASALDYAHAKKDDNGRPLRIIHRDVSPSNVLVSFEGEVKLIDFGIAKAVKRTQETAVGTLKGKSSYMSPEQVTGQPVDHRSDIFSFGTVLFELLTGEHPFRATDELITLDRIREAKPVRPRELVPAVAPELEAICLRALSKNPGERHATAGEMEQQLDHFCQEHPLSRRELSAWVKRAFRERLERPLIPGSAVNDLGRRLAGEGTREAEAEADPEATRLEGPDRTPTHLEGLVQAPDPQAIMNLDTAPLMVDAGLTPPQDQELPPVPEEVQPAQVGPPPKRKRPLRGLVVLSVLLALATIAAVAYLTFTGVRRGPNWLPMPDPVPRTAPLDDTSGAASLDAGARADQ